MDYTQAIHQIRKNLTLQSQLLESLHRLCVNAPVNAPSTQNPVISSSVMELLELHHANQIQTVSVLESLTPQPEASQCR